MQDFFVNLDKGTRFLHQDMVYVKLQSAAYFEFSDDGNELNFKKVNAVSINGHLSFFENQIKVISL